MKKKFFTLCLFTAAALSSYAQTPDSFQYQAVVSDQNFVLKNTEVQVRLSIHEESATGTKVYTEVHTARTNEFGMVALQVGKGVADKTAFASIDWCKGPYFLETEIDKGAGFVPAGTQQLMSVPFAKYADSANKIILTSMSGKKFAVTIDDNGNIATEEISQK